MTNLEKLKNCFIEGLEIDETTLKDATMESVENWDSIGQMSLIALIEDSFGIELEPDEIMGIRSFETSLDVLKKRGLEF